MLHFAGRIRERHKIILLMLAGLALSVWFVGRLGDELWQQAVSAGRDGLIGLSDRVMEQTAWKSTILLWRGMLPTVWFLVGCTAGGAMCLYVSWIFFGFSAGVLWWLMLSVGGWRGPFFMWALMFPQYLCYLPALLLWYIGCLRWRSLRKQYPISFQNILKIPDARLFLLRLSLGGLLYSAGIWAEIRINPWIYERFFTIS